MHPLAIAVGLVLFVSALAFILKPFRSRPAGIMAPTPMGTRTAHGRGATLSAIRDLDFDFRTGKVCQEDYESLRPTLMAAAARSVEAEAVEDAEIESLIRARRAAAAAAAACPSCGHPYDAGSRYCTHCGAALQTCCRGCGAPVMTANTYCPSCGMRLGVPVRLVV